MDLELSNKVFIVTGGAKGIGYAICEKLVEEGAKVMIVGRKEPDNLKAMVSLLTKGADVARTFQAELSDSNACKGAVEATLKEWGKVDGLINNAGANDGVSLRSGSPEDFERSLRNNLLHYYNLAHYALPSLIKNKGCILNIGSKVAETGQGGTSGYAAAKGAINALTREWAVELLPQEVRVNCVIPAEVWTPLYESWINTFEDPHRKLESITRKIPLGHRMTTAEEIADMCVFLCSPLSSHTTGQIIYVDGGYTHLDRAIT